jgi:hypothetical protein
LLPNGITAAVFGASLSNNDNGMVNLSGLNQHLLSILTPTAETGFYPALYGDAIMQLTPVLLSYFRNPDDRQRIWNRRMSSARMSIELDYGLLFNNFRVMIREENKQLYRNGLTVFRLGIVCCFLKNCYICLNGSTTNGMFNTTPQSIEEYLNVVEVIEQFQPVELTMDYNYGY